MLDEPAFPFDWATADRAYRNYVENCRRMGLEPMSWDRVKAQITEWSDALAVSRPPPVKY